MKIPIVINNRDRFTTTKNLVEKLLLSDTNEKIIILDNGSTYTPLLNWYDFVSSKIEVRYYENEGHLALWATGLYKELGEYFVYTDSDIELDTNLPQDWKERMLGYCQKYETKVAMALRIDDLPNHYKYKNQVIRNEGRWWLKQIEPDIYEADTDTTFFMMRNTGDNQYKSLRIAKSGFMCRHHPWYLNLDNLDPEEKYYLDHVGERVTTQYTKQHKNPNEYGDI